MNIEWYIFLLINFFILFLFKRKTGLKKTFIFYIILLISLLFFWKNDWEIIFGIILQLHVIGLIMLPILEIYGGYLSIKNEFKKQEMIRRNRNN